MKHDEAVTFLLEALEHERGGVRIYETALECARHEDLTREWTRYLEETRSHAAVLGDVCTELGIDADQPAPGREIVRDLAKSLLAAMRKALAKGSAEAAQVVACECVVIAETKDHANWELLGHVAEKLGGSARKLLRDACERIEEEEGEHLFHTKGWCRELWLQKLGIRAVLPPPEEQKHVKTAIGASRAEQARDEMLRPARARAAT